MYITDAPNDMSIREATMLNARSTVLEAARKVAVDYTHFQSPEAEGEAILKLAEKFAHFVTTGNMGGEHPSQLDRIEATLRLVLEGEGYIMLNEQQTIDLLKAGTALITTMNQKLDDGAIDDPELQQALAEFQSAVNLASAQHTGTADTPPADTGATGDAGATDTGTADSGTPADGSASSGDAGTDSGPTTTDTGTPAEEEPPVDAGAGDEEPAPVPSA